MGCQRLSVKLELINYSSKSGDSKQNKSPTKRGGCVTTAYEGGGGVSEFVIRATQNCHFFDVASKP